jgi:adenosylcobinamide kinase / adenosylcobinamide-phosphate guanylyltransferase
VASAHLILGGARSGKSRFAVASQPARGRVIVVATAQAGDADMATRIARHRAERPGHWRTLEEPYALVPLLDRLDADAADAVLVDCLTVWVANRLLRGDPDQTILTEAERLARIIGCCPWPVTLVSNEVGEGVHPETEAGLRFRDLLGLANQQVAAACDRVTLMVAGVPLTVKSPIASHDLAPEAP